MKSTLRKFLRPSKFSYWYSVPFTEVKDAVENAIKKDSSFMTSKDIAGQFLDHSTFYFQLETSPFWISPIFNSDLTGRIGELSESETNVEVVIRSNIFLIALFYILLSIGLCVTLVGFINDTRLIFSGILTIVIFSGGCLGLGNMLKASLHERYLIYIHKLFLR